MEAPNAKQRCPPCLSARVRRAARQDEGDEDALAVLAADDVEAEPGRALVEHHVARVTQVLIGNGSE